MVNVGYDLNDIAERFLKWYQEGYMTSYGEAFDIGGTTSVAMDRLIEGVSPLRAGPAEGRDNGIVLYYMKNSVLNLTWKH